MRGCAARFTFMADVTPLEIAQWMLDSVNAKPGEMFLQADAVEAIERRFGPEFVYENENGNPAIDTRVLRKFRKLSEDSVIWDRWEFGWRRRQPNDGPGRKQE